MPPWGWLFILLFSYPISPCRGTWWNCFSFGGDKWPWGDSTPLSLGHQTLRRLPSAAWGRGITLLERDKGLSYRVFSMEGEAVGCWGCAVSQLSVSQCETWVSHPTQGLCREVRRSRRDSMATVTKPGSSCAGSKAGQEVTQEPRWEEKGGQLDNCEDPGDFHQ